jgi:cardiolipin synthase
MQIIIQPDEGVEPVVASIESARTSIDIVVFRLDMRAIVTALGAAVARGVAVRALVAHTNKGDEQGLRKLEVQLLGAGVTVSRTAGDLVRYHGKMMIVDGRKLHVHGFNFTSKDIGNSRSFGAVTTARQLVKEALTLFQADSDRQPYTEGCARFLVSPVNSRTRLMAFLAGARRQLWIYDQGVSDPRMLKVLAERQRAGVDVRVIGRVGARSAIKAEKYPGKRLHVRAIIRDKTQAFLGSQSLRALELDGRREVGLIIRERPAVRKLVATFEADWALIDAARPAAATAPVASDAAEAAVVKNIARKDAAATDAVTKEVVGAARHAAKATAGAEQATAKALAAALDAVNGDDAKAPTAAKRAAAVAKAAAKHAKAAAKAAAQKAETVEGRARRLAREAAAQAKAAAQQAKAAAKAAKAAAKDATTANEE